MDTSNEALLEDLIDCTVEETVVDHKSLWTEQALDLFISLLKNVQKETNSNQKEMLKAISDKMSSRGYNFNLENIEKKYNSLKRMYLDKKVKNQNIEPELSRLFDGARDSNISRNEDSQPSQKKARLDLSDDVIQIVDDPVEVTENKEKTIWANKAVKIFLDLLEELRPQLGDRLRTKREMWDEISLRLKDHGYSFTQGQVENKWKGLLRHYRGRLMRNGGSARNSNLNSTAFPELFENRMPRKSECKDYISFANDQKLPYEDDGYRPDESNDLEETCLMPEIEIASDDTDPFLLNDVKPFQRTSTSKEIHNTEETVTNLPNLQVDKIVEEISKFRTDNQSYQQKSLKLKQLQLEAYKQRTAQLAKIGDGLNALLRCFQRNAQDGNIL